MEITEIHFDSIDSTSAYALREYASFAPDAITVITADKQSAGRGRRQRRWISPPGVNLYATFCFRLPLFPKNDPFSGAPSFSTKHLGSLAIVAAYSLASILLSAGLHPTIKWPNDILLSNKKLSGILSETIFQPDSIQVFLGIGINVNMEKADLDQIDQPATSLKQETNRAWDRAALLNDLKIRLSADLDLFKKEGFAPFRNPIEQILAKKGETIRCFDGEKEWVGICHSLGEDGRLNLLLPNGQLHPLLSGDLQI